MTDQTQNNSQKIPERDRYRSIIWSSPTDGAVVFAVDDGSLRCQRTNDGGLTWGGELNAEIIHAHSGKTYICCTEEVDVKDVAEYEIEPNISYSTQNGKNWENEMTDKTQSYSEEEIAFNKRWARNVPVGELPCNEPILKHQMEEFKAGWQAALSSQAEQIRKLERIISLNAETFKVDEEAINALQARIDEADGQEPAGYMQKGIFTDDRGRVHVSDEQIPVFSKPPITSEALALTPDLAAIKEHDAKVLEEFADWLMVLADKTTTFVYAVDELRRRASELRQP